MPPADVCVNILSYYPIQSFIPGCPNTIGIFMFILGAIYILMSLLTIAFIKSQEFKASKQDSEVVSNIFPIFVNVLWLSALASIVAGIVVCFVPFDPINGNNILSASLYAFMSSFQHAVIEGIAFLLMQKGCGQYAAITAFKWTGLWTCLVFTMTFFIYKYEDDVGDALEVILDLVLFIFYVALWLAPKRILFRRPAVYIYARFWAYFRFAAIIIKVLFFFRDTEDIAACGYLFATLLLFAIFQPLICYWTLLQDSDWWQGLDINPGQRRESFENIKSPLLGVDISVVSAQSLAHTMDVIRWQKQVKMVNFANIKVDMKNHLGAGSSSKVFKGSYLKNECAVKMIYTFDLTTDVIRRIAAEASILSSIKHPNVVHIYGVTVLPPSVCLLLELCHFGSLSDIIHGQGFDWNPSASKSSMSLCMTDRIYLALGCARGVAAVHEYDPFLCHRDIKSFNFLVDSQFNVKIADLELGGRNQAVITDTVQSAAEGVPVEELLANWMAPEILRGEPYSQLADVYSLGIVFWEIISGILPFEGLSQSDIRRKIASGYRHAIPMEYVSTPYSNLICQAWSENRNDRPTSQEIASKLEVILQEICYRVISDTDNTVDLSHVIAYYNRTKQLSTNSVHGHTTYKVGSIIGMKSNPLNVWPNISRTDDDMGIGDQKTSWWGRHSEPIASTAPSTVPSSSYHKNRLKMSSSHNIKSSLPLPVHTPSILIDIVCSIQEDRSWSVLESTGLSWAVFSSASPHIFIYATSQLNYLFGLENEQDNVTIKSFRDFTMDMTPFRNTSTVIEASKRRYNRSNLMNTDVEEDKLLPRHPSRESLQSIYSVNQQQLDYAMASNNNSIASSILSSFSFSRSADSVQGLFSGSHIQMNSHISEVYVHAASSFLNNLQDNHESHGVIPMTRKLGRTLDHFLCSLHAYAIYPRRREDIPSNSSPKSKRYLHDRKSNEPVYYAILFNELKDRNTTHSSMTNQLSQANHEYENLQDNSTKSSIGSFLSFVSSKSATLPPIFSVSDSGKISVNGSFSSNGSFSKKNPLLKASDFEDEVSFI